MPDILFHFWNLIPITFAQGLIISFVTAGIMLPFRILGFPDLTSEGTYPLGGCVCAVLMLADVDPLIAMTLAMVCGFAAGACTAFIHLRFGINTLLAGILVMTMLYSINLRILGRSNAALFSKENIFTPFVDSGADETLLKIVLVGAVVAALFTGLWYFLKTERGAAMRAVGASPEMAEAQGINNFRYTLVGVGIASAFTALGGSIMVQSQGFADVNMGFGILINGLAALMIGEAILGRESVGRQLAAPFIGTLIYYQLVSLCLSFGLAPSDLKLATGGFVLLMLALPRLKKGNRGATPVREQVKE